MTAPNGPVSSPGDWIGYRHSLAHVWTRIDAGELRELIPVCDSCGTELDVRAVVHSPRCVLLLGHRPPVNR